MNYSAGSAAPASGGSVTCELDGFEPDVVRWLVRAYEALKAGEFEDAEVGFRWLHLALLHATEAARLASGAIGQDP